MCVGEPHPLGITLTLTLHNLFTELPHILTGELKVECQKLLRSHLSKEKLIGADLRALAINALIFFQNEGNDDLITLMDTIVRVSSILYSSYSYRSPRTILQLYNKYCIWLHHEMTTKLFTRTHELSRGKLFGMGGY